MYIVRIFKEEEGKNVLEGAMFFDEKQMAISAAKALPQNKKGHVFSSQLTVKDFFDVVGKELNG